MVDDGEDNFRIAEISGDELQCTCGVKSLESKYDSDGEFAGTVYFSWDDEIEFEDYVPDSENYDNEMLKQLFNMLGADEILEEIPDLVDREAEIAEFNAHTGKYADD